MTKSASDAFLDLLKTMASAPKPVKFRVYHDPDLEEPGTLRIDIMLHNTWASLDGLMAGIWDGDRRGGLAVLTPELVNDEERFADRLAKVLKKFDVALQRTIAELGKEDS